MVAIFVILLILLLVAIDAWIHRQRRRRGGESSRIEAGDPT
jgi:cbb3-type cytochrome oxidase subunit 3